jgi:SOS-response transcriptional repressor LexA
MNKYQILQQNLKDTGTGKMKVFGKSMIPIIKSGSTLTFKKQDEYEIGDIVYCKVHGRIIDAHKIIKKSKNKQGFRYLIANNHGWENGWTTQIFGKVVAIEAPLV